jgi:glycosyltransferase involved in cell wall biosynthesis
VPEDRHRPPPAAGPVPGRRLLIVSLSPLLGGAERSMLLLARHLPEHGWDTVVACPPGELAARVRQAGIEAAVVSWRSVDAVSRRTGARKRYPPGALLAAAAASLGNALRVLVLARRLQVDVVVSNSLHAHPFVTLGGRLAGRRVVWHVRDIVDPGRGRTLLAGIARWAHGLLAVSQAVAATVPHRRRLVLANPVELGGWERPGTAPARVVGFIGRLDREKGLDELIQAAELVDASFVVVGEPRYTPPEYLDELMAMADRRAPGRVRFVGAVDGPGQALPGFAVLAVPSRREPFGRVAAEALLCGVPVVAAATGGLPEVVRDGVDGFLYPSGDVRALADRLRRLLDDDELRARMSAAARAGAARFLPSQHASRAAAFLNGIVGRRSHHARSSPPSVPW